MDKKLSQLDIDNIVAQYYGEVKNKSNTNKCTDSDLRAYSNNLSQEDIDKIIQWYYSKLNEK